MKTSALLLVIVITARVGCAQSSEKRIAYLSKDRKEVFSAGDAAFSRTIEEAGDGFILREYYQPSGKLRVIAECIEYEPEIVYHGTVKHYYENGILRREGRYEEGYATGVFVEYYETGTICQRKEYQSDDKELILQHYTPDGKEELTQGNGIISTADGETVCNLEIKNYLLLNSYRIKGGDTVYTDVEKPAEFPGGMTAMMKFLQTHVKYPADARRNGIQGSVLTGFDVDKNGKISNLSTVRGVSEDLNDESLRVISAMPHWLPARVGGKAVKSRFVLPIKFKLATSNRRR